MIASGTPGGDDAFSPPRATARLGTVRSDIAVYGLSTALGQGIALVAVPLYARWLGPTEYGAVELLTVVTSFIVTGCGDAVSSAVQKIWFEVTDPPRRSRVVPTGVVVGTAAAGVASAAVILGVGLVGAEWRIATVVAVVGAVLTVTARVSAEQFRVSRRPWPYLAAMVTRALVGAGVALVLVHVVSPTAASVLVGFAIGSAISIFVTSRLGREFPFTPVGDLRLVRQVLALSVPLVPAALSGWSMMLIDRFVVAHYEPLSQVGVYGLASRMSSGLLLLVYAFTSAWTPFALGRINAADVDEARERPIVLRHMSALIICGGIALALVAPTVVERAVGRDYREAADLVPVLAFAFVLLGSVSVTQVPLLAAGRVRTMAVASIAAAVVNLAAAMVLVRSHGIEGAAVATVIGFGTQAVLYLWLGGHQRRAPGMVSAAVRSWTAAGVVLAAVALLRELGDGRLALVVPVALPLLLVLTGVLSSGEIRALVQLRTGRASE